MAGKLPVLRGRATSRLAPRPRPGVETRPPHRLARLLQAATIGVFQREWPRGKWLDCCMYRVWRWSDCFVLELLSWVECPLFLVGVNRSGAEWGFQMGKMPPPLSRGNLNIQRILRKKRHPLVDSIFGFTHVKHEMSCTPPPQAINCMENRQTPPINHHPTPNYRSSR